MIDHLPPGHRAYYWNGRPYYWSSGYWYRPYGSNFVVVGSPIGLFVSTLPVIGVYLIFQRHLVRAVAAGIGR